MFFSTSATPHDSKRHAGNSIKQQQQQRQQPALKLRTQTTPKLTRHAVKPGGAGRGGVGAEEGGVGAGGKTRDSFKRAPMQRSTVMTPRKSRVASPLSPSRIASPKSPAKTSKAQVREQRNSALRHNAALLRRLFLALVRHSSLALTLCPIF